MLLYFALQEAWTKPRGRLCSNDRREGGPTIDCTSESYPHVTQQLKTRRFDP